MESPVGCASSCALPRLTLANKTLVTHTANSSRRMEASFGKSPRYRTRPIERQQAIARFVRPQQNGGVKPEIRNSKPELPVSGFEFSSGHSPTCRAVIPPLPDGEEAFRVMFQGWI